MKLKVINCEIYISLLFVSMLSFIMLLDKSGFMLLGIAAVILHEAGHLAVMCLCGVLPDEIILQPVGVIIKRSGVISGYYRDMLIAAAGCATNIAAAAVSLVIYSIWLNDFYACFAAVNLSIAAFNLLPVSGLDGSDIIRNLLLRKTDVQRAENICMIISLAAIALLSSFVVASILLTGRNYMLALCVVYLIVLTVLNLRY